MSRYSVAEEIANAVSHGIGTLLSIVALVAMVLLSVATDDPWRVVASSIYGGSMVLLFLASTLYHAWAGEETRHYLKKFDHASIYLLIAGSYTPFMLVELRNWMGWTIFSLVWALAIGGVVLKLFSAARYKHLSLVSYLAMGWLVLPAAPALYYGMGTGGLLWLAAGGVVYSSGVIFYVQKSKPYTHSLWHLFVLGGAACHFCAVYLYVLPQ